MYVIYELQILPRWQRLEKRRSHFYNNKEAAEKHAGKIRGSGEVYPRIVEHEIHDTFHNQ